MEWKEVNVTAHSIAMGSAGHVMHVYVSEKDGRVCGTAEPYRGLFECHVGDRHVGTYIDVATAKAAIETAFEVGA